MTSVDDRADPEDTQGAEDAEALTDDEPGVRFDCNDCPAYCCSYAHIPVTGEDLCRLAGHFALDIGRARQRFVKRGDEENPLVLRHKADEHYGSVCRFLDSETRQCTIYEARPAICRDFPAQDRCGYYDFLTFEREVQDDESWVAVTR